MRHEASYLNVHKCVWTKFAMLLASSKKFLIYIRVSRIHQSLHFNVLHMHHLPSIYEFIDKSFYRNLSSQRKNV